MFINFLTIAWRVLMRQKIYSTINVLGLTTGITASLLILVYVADELSYDRFLDGGERIYRVNFTGRLQEADMNTVEVGLPMAEALQREVSGVEAVTRIDKWMTCPVRYEDRAFTEMNFLLADSNFFSFFSYKLLLGNPKEALRGAGKIVISETAARRYFNYQGPGDLSPLGKMLVIGSEGAILAEVTGIAEDSPHNTHLRYDFIMSLPTSGYINSPVWLNFVVYTYIKLLPGTPVANVQSTMDGFIRKYCAREIQQFLNVSLDQFLEKGGRLSFGAQPLYDIHLRSHFPDELEPNGNMEYVYLFGAIAFFIVVLACINFMNLSTARSANRAKEIGVRKSVGARRSLLMGQFFTESFLYCLIAVAIAFVLVHVMLTPFNLLSGKTLSMDMLYQPRLLVGFLGLALFVGLLSGSYPAFYLTAFQPVDVLKGRLRSGKRNSRIRNVLVIFQFSVSISLIIASMMVYFQLVYLQQQDVGFQKQNVVGLIHTMNLGNQAEAFKQEVLKYPEFVAASFSSRLPPNVDWGATFRTETGDENYPMSVVTSDHDQLKALGLTMVEGRFFSPDFISDTTAVVINETAAVQFGFTDPVGSYIRYTGVDNLKLKVIGVVKDFNFETLKSTIHPMVMFLETGANWDIAIRLSEGDPAPKIARLAAIWKKFAPQSPFEYSFIDQDFDLKFRSEERLSHVILAFTSLAIFIACLGLLGLATFTAEQRSKEIGIRKVFGASLSTIVILLSKDFLRLILVALVIAVPITWYGITRWLESFAYRTSFSIPLVLAAGGIAVLAALLTVSYRAIRAAIENPVNALKSE